MMVAVMLQKMLVNQVMNLSRWNIGSEHYRVKILFKDLC